MKKMLAIALIAVLFFGLAPWSYSNVAYAASVESHRVTVHPKEINDVLRNPGMGWIMIDNVIAGHPEMLDRGQSWESLIDERGEGGNVDDPYPYIQNISILSDWSTLEPIEGQYKFSTVLDPVIEYWESKGKRIHFRISTDAMIYSPFYAGGPPAWLTSIVPTTTRTDQNTTFKVVDWSDATAQAKLNNFMTAFTDYYKNRESLDIVEMLGYGTWGEWHSGHNFPDIDTRIGALQDVIDQWADKWSPKLVALSVSPEYRPSPELLPNVVIGGNTYSLNAPPNYESFLKWSAFDYGLTKSNVTFRRNGFGGAMREYDTTLLKQVFQSNRNLPIMGEFFGIYPAYKGEGGYAGRYSPESALDEALNFHPNYLLIQGHDMHIGAPDFYHERKDLLYKGLKQIGYRFVLKQAQYPGAVKQGDSFTLSQTWSNEAVGRSTGQYPLKIYLTDSGGQTVWSETDTDFDQRSFVKGELYDIDSSFAIPSNLPVGTYDLRIAMVDGEDTPAIQLGIEGKDSMTRYKLGTIRIVDSGDHITNVSLSEGFEGAPAGASYQLSDSRFTSVVNPANAKIATAAPQLINGERTVYGSSSAATDWYEFLHSDLNKIAFQGGATYQITFSYKPLAAPGAGGFYYFLARSASGGADKGVTQWTEAASTSTQTKTITFTLDPYDDYYLIWGLHYGGQLSVDDIKISLISDPNETFESGSFAGSSYISAYGNGMIGSTGSKVIAGSYSAYGETPVSSPPEWHNFLHSDTTKLHLTRKGTYSVTFKYRVTRESAENDDYFYFLARTDTGGYAKDKGFARWQDDAGETHVRTVVFTLDDYNDYYLIWGIHNGGGIAIDDIKVTRSPASAYETFEGGTLSGTNFRASANPGSGTVTNSGSVVVSGAYSLHGRNNTGAFQFYKHNEWYDVLLTDWNEYKFKPNTHYTVTFRFKPNSQLLDISSEPWDRMQLSGSYYFIAHSPKFGHTYYNEWMEKPGTGDYVKTFSFTTANAADYSLIWGIHNLGNISIDDVTIIENR